MSCHKIGVCIVACLSSISVPIPSSLAYAETQATFYVATNGNDGWSGKLDAPNSGKTDGPFSTLARARDAVRELKARQAHKEPITVLVRGGKYYLNETLAFEREDSGSREAPVTYEAYPGEKPVLSGGRRVQGWKAYKGRFCKRNSPIQKGARGSSGNCS
jgi:hypothetical protein